ncbi:MAG TPA: hypothetical protein VN951_00440 [Pyrinomonadaceae bacterium]|nr:hypothetical protein [Pyrinomonadaceae bacterium]
MITRRYYAHAGIPPCHNPDRRSAGIERCHNIDGVCSQLHLATDSTKVQGSYEVLKNYGNLSSASTGFMLAEKDDWKGPTIVVGFGVGFTASAGIMNYN